jgi:hypothetical protein
MTDMLVNSLSGDARTFYDREFGFFKEVTSFTGKLKLFIQQSKPEKKARPSKFVLGYDLTCLYRQKTDEDMVKIVIDIEVPSQSPS